jgi:ABC-2 type transport system permease protein
LLGISSVIILIEGKVKVPFHEFFNTVCYFTFILALVLLLSSLLNERMSLFVGIVVGLALPVLWMVTDGSENLGYKIISYLLPFRYIQANWDILIILLISAVLLALTLYLFSGKEV